MEFRGTGGDCFVFLISRTLLVLCTFGIYGFWLAKDWKGWVVSHTYVHGKRLIYRPRFGEFVLGRLVAMLGMVLTLGFYIPWAKAKGLRFDWRMTKVADGRSCRFLGDGTGYFGTWLLGVFLKVITLGFASPWVVAMRTGWMRRNLVIGGQRVGFDGTGGQVFWTVLLGRLLTLLTLGLYLPWRMVAVQRWIAVHSHVAYGEDTTEAPRDPVEEFIARRAADKRTWIALGAAAALFMVGMLGLMAVGAVSELIRDLGDRRPVAESTAPAESDEIGQPPAPSSTASVAASSSTTDGVAPVAKVTPVNTGDFVTARVVAGETLDEADLSGLSCEELWQLRNWVYARHGYSFSTEKARTYFGAQSGYTRDSGVTKSTVSRHLTGTDGANRDLIVRVEKRRGCR